MTQSTSNISPRRTFGALAIAVVGFAVQQTAIVPAIYDVEASLGASQAWSAWLVTIYLMIATVATPALGRLAELYGERKMLLIGLAIFMLSSIGAALSPSISVLLIFRAIQGIGGAVYPLALALARAHLPQAHQTRSLSFLAAAFGAGTGLGFVIGGILAQYATWRLIFALGALLVAVAILAIVRWVAETDHNAHGGYDTVGTGMLATAAIALLAGLTLSTLSGWSSPITLGLVVVAVIAAVCWVGHERRARHPLVDLRIFREHTVVVANLATIGLGWALFSSYLLIPKFARAADHGYGLNLQSAAIGLLMLVLAIGQTTMSSVAGLVHVPPWLSFSSGLVAAAAGLVILSYVPDSLIGVICAFLLFGLGVGTAMQSSSATATQGVDANIAAESSSVNSTVRRLAGGIGGQTSTLVLGAMPLASGATSFAAFRTSYLIAAGMCLLGAVALAVGHRRC